MALSKLGFFGVAAIAAVLPTMAQASLRLDRQMFVEKTQMNINGQARRVLESTNRTVPGDRLVYVVRWSNVGDQSVNRPTFVEAMPRGMQPEVNDPDLIVSIDGGQNWGRLDQLWLPNPLGGVRRAVSADVTHVRWTIPQAVSPGASGLISFRAVAIHTK